MDERWCAVTPRRSPRELLVDLARPDEDWWFSFATDTAYDLVETLLEHPDAYRLPAIERGLLPVDPHAAQILRSSLERDSRLRLTDDARHALTEAGRGAVPRARAPVDSLGYDVELRRDSRGGDWILIGSDHAPLARALAAAGRLPLFDGPAGSVALAEVQTNAVGIADLLGRLDLGSVDPHMRHWLERTTTWRGTIEVDGPREAPVFLLIGDNERLPTALRELASTCPGGVRLPLTLESWRVIDAQPLEGWISRAAKRCAAALETGQPAPPAVLELSVVQEQSTFVLAPGHDLELLDHFAQLPGVAAGRAGRSEHHHDSLPAIVADPFWVPELDRFIADHDPWVAPDALERLQQDRDEHALAAGVVALSAASEAALNVPGLGGELKPFQRAGVQYLLKQRRSFLADEQGLGKTIEALATIETDGAYPTIVVCPASLKLNWMREIERWLPARSAQTLDGNRGAVAAADVTVVNYDIVAGRLDALSALTPRAVVLDESHYSQEPPGTAHAGRPAIVRGRAARCPRAGADRHAAVEPAAGADLPVADLGAPR